MREIVFYPEDCLPQNRVRLSSTTCGHRATNCVIPAPPSKDEIWIKHCRENKICRSGWFHSSLSHISNKIIMGLGKISTRKLQHERADVTLELKRTLLTSPSSSPSLTLTLTLTPTLILTAHPHLHARAEVSSCLSFRLPIIIT
jgi:hypothetical protein